MRILIAGTTGESMPPPYGGIPKVSLLYARAWRQAGNDVALVFVHRPKDADDLGAGARYFFEYDSRPDTFRKIAFLFRYALRKPALYVSLLRAYLAIYPHPSPEAALYAAYGVYMDGVIVEYKPDVLLLEAALIKSFMAAQVAKRRKVPVVIDTYAEVQHLDMGVNARLDHDGRRRYWTAFLGMAELVLGISNCTAGALQYLTADKVRKFHDTCDFTLCRMPFPESRAALRRAFGLPEEGFIVGMVGAFAERKGHDHLLRAVAPLVREGKDVAVAICGGSGDPGALAREAAALGVADRVRFLSRLSETDLAKFLRCLDLYANLSHTPRSCGLDLALLEGMASGLPVLVYDHGGLRDAVPDGGNGWVVPTGDIPAVTRALADALGKTPDERRAMGAESAAIARKADIRNASETKLAWLKEAVERYKVRGSYV